MKNRGKRDLWTSSTSLRRDRLCRKHRREITDQVKKMLKSSSYVYTSTRRISFFVPSTRLNEFNKRQLQNNASLETFVKNYEEIQQYSAKFDTSLHGTNLNSLDQTSEFQFNPKVDVLANSLNSINFKFLHEENEKTAVYTFSDKTKSEKFIPKVRFLLYDSDLRNLYNFLKCNVNKITHFEGNLSSYEISLIIKRLLYYNDSLAHRLKFVTKNKHYLDEEVDHYVKKLNSFSRAVYQSTKSIFNRLSKIGLSLYDYENIILFHYQKNYLNKAIELISELEKKVLESPEKYHLTNTLWAIKMDILSQTNTSFWKIYGETIYKLNSNSRVNFKYTYPHHGHNFQTLVKRYETEKEKNSLPDSTPVLEVIIKGMGKHGDLTALDSFIESNWGVKNDRRGDKRVYFLEHFNIKKRINGLLWPNEDVLISILLAYAKNGDLATALEINNLILDKYNHEKFLNASNTIKYWTLALRCSGLYGDALDKQLAKDVPQNELSDALGTSLLEVKYRFFDSVWQMSEKYVNHLNRDMIKLKIKYASSHELLKGLPNFHSKMTEIKYNKMSLNLKVNETALNNYVRECCVELARRGRFLDASQLIERFVSSEQAMNELKEMLVEMQEAYARERVKHDEKKRQIIDDDDDFELW